MAEHRVPTFYEFFAGGGMARAGLGKGWQCLFANDFDAKKAESYRDNWEGAVMVQGDVAALSAASLPELVDLAWASFPCQDLSLAGGGAGLKGDRSGTFWPFWRLMEQLVGESRAPRVIALENVLGTLTSHGGRDFEAICGALSNAGYWIGAIVVDAALFVPQSRPRLFVVATREPIRGASLVRTTPSDVWHPKNLVAAHARLSERVKKRWVWWELSVPSEKPIAFSQIVESNPNDVPWHAAHETQKLLSMMTPLNLRKVAAAKASGQLQVGTVYRRTRRDADGFKAQRAEVRFDDFAGCLRTPAGGSSRQILLFVDGDRVKSRLISARETARLMGLEDSYILPERYNDAYHLTGDGVAVPVVRHISRELLLPLVGHRDERLVA